jgi:hypothetical protein
MGFVRRMSVFERKALDQQLFDVLKEELDDGRIAGYGKGLLYSYFKHQGRLVTR